MNEKEQVAFWLTGWRRKWLTTTINDNLDRIWSRYRIAELRYRKVNQFGEFSYPDMTKK